MLTGICIGLVFTAILFSMVGYFNGNDRTLWVMIPGKNLFGGQLNWILDMIEFFPL